MKELLFDHLPPSLWAGLGLLAGLAWLAAPEAGRRIAALEALPGCVAGLEAQPKGNPAAAIEREIVTGVLDYLAGQAPASELGRRAKGLADGLRASGPRSASNDAASRCRCLVEAAVRDTEVRRDVALHLLTLRMVSESGVADLAGHMARKKQGGACATEVRP